MLIFTALVLDISKHVVVFEAIVRLISAIARAPTIHGDVDKFLTTSTTTTYEQQPTVLQADDDSIGGNEKSIDVCKTLLISEKGDQPSTSSQSDASGSGGRSADLQFAGVFALLEKLKTLEKNIGIYLKKVAQTEGGGSGPSWSTLPCGSKKRIRKIGGTFFGSDRYFISLNTFK